MSPSSKPELDACGVRRGEEGGDEANIMDGAEDDATSPRIDLPYVRLIPGFGAV